MLGVNQMSKPKVIFLSFSFRVSRSVFGFINFFQILSFSECWRNVCIFFPKMMKVTKTKDIAPFISISSILKVPLFPNLTLPFFTVLGQRGRLDREDPLIMEYWNRVLLLPVRWWGVNCEKPLQTELREH